MFTRTPEPIQRSNRHLDCKVTAPSFDRLGLDRHVERRCQKKRTVWNRALRRMEARLRATVCDFSSRDRSPSSGHRRQLTALPLRIDSAINHQPGAGDVSTARPRQKGNCRRYVLDLAKTTERNL